MRPKGQDRSEEAKNPFFSLFSLPFLSPFLSSFLEIDETMEMKLINEEYKIWKKNTPFL